jgi:NAD(P)-dependent dehydrogenase (short-subunit alcohol dehydrogenase family)
MAKDETPMFRNKVAVITGAGSGIGRATSLQLAAQGARLALSDINLANVEETATLATAAGAPEVYSYELDVADKDATFATAATVKERFGTVNFVMNNAGVAVSKNVLEMPLSDFEWLMGINFWGVVYGTYAYLPTLIESGDGHLVNISSLFGLLAVPTQSAYNAAKFGVRGFTEALRQEMMVAKAPVQVHCVHPGGVKTNIARAARAQDGVAPDELARRFDKIATLSPDQAATIILKGVRRGSPRILVGNDARALDLMQRLLGSGYQQIISRGASRINP